MNINLKSHLFRRLFAVIAAWCFSVTLAAADPPDLTADPPEPIPIELGATFNLGTTGMGGWAFYKKSNT